MNQLQIRHQIHRVDGDDGRYLVSEVLVDGEAIHDFTWVATCLYALRDSLEGSGPQYILTCWCGVPECARIHKPIAVTHRGSFVHWMMSDENPVRHFKFDAAAYRSVIRQAFIDGRELLRRDPPAPRGTLEVVPSSNEEFLVSLLREKR